MTLVVDSSVVVAALVDSSPVGTWAAGLLSGGSVSAPHILPAEVANVLRRAARAGSLSDPEATLAMEDVLTMPVEYFSFEPFGRRVWQLRGSVSAYDAWYLALAEALDAPLATLDRRLVNSNGATCQFLLPPE